MLDGEYAYEIGTEEARMDKLLQKNGIETFLISPQFYLEVNVCYTCTLGGVF